MAFNEALAERIRHGLVRKKGIEDRKMFGGIGFLLHFNMLVGVRKDSPLVRLGPEQSDEALKEAHVSELKNPGPGHDEGMGTVRPGGYRGRRPVEGLD